MAQPTATRRCGPSRSWQRHRRLPPRKLCRPAGSTSAAGLTAGRASDSMYRLDDAERRVHRHRGRQPHHASSRGDKHPPRGLQRPVPYRGLDVGRERTGRHCERGYRRVHLPTGQGVGLPTTTSNSGTTPGTPAPGRPRRETKLRDTQEAGPELLRAGQGLRRASHAWSYSADKWEIG